MSKPLQVKQTDTDVLIIGGGTAGCYAALTISRNSDASVLVAEKANIKRSGCLAAGVNAINAYIVKGRKPQDYVDYATKDAAGIVRNDLLLTAAEEFNNVTADMERLGLVILKDENGDYVARGNRNIKINGENFKPLLADAVYSSKNVDVSELRKYHRSSYRKWQSLWSSWFFHHGRNCLCDPCKSSPDRNRRSCRPL